MDELKNIVFKTVGFEYDKKIEVIQYDGVYASLSNGKAVVGASSKSELARAFFIFAKSCSEKMGDFEIIQKKHFKNLGVMIDVSRNAVVNIKTLEKYIEMFACLGFNFLMLYTEDTYEIKSRPYFGYMRGRYTKEELQHIDEYAKNFGIELVPCIQTLAHLSQYLKWARHSWDIRDTENTLLMNADETFEFIEDEIETCREAFSSKRIHIGMDEAFDLGQGRYKARKGEPLADKFGEMKKHLQKVVEICKKYNFEPMMWSDMFLRFKSSLESQFVDPTITFTEEEKRDFPDVGLVYWQYRPDDKEVFKKMLEIQRTITDKVIYAGATGAESGFVPSGKKAMAYSETAMQGCLESGIKNVFCTIWGDDGNDTNLFWNLFTLPVFSEYCYLGLDCTFEDIKKTASFLTGVDFDDIGDVFSKFINCHGEDTNPRGIFFGDILYGMGADEDKVDVLFPELKKRAETCAKLKEKYPEKRDLFREMELLFGIMSYKAKLIGELRTVYKKGDREYFIKLADKELPQLKKDYEEFFALLRKQWLDTYKSFGFEVQVYRIGGIIAQIDETIRTIKEWLKGDIDKIGPLEEKLLPTYRIGETAKCFVTPSNII